MSAVLTIEHEILSVDLESSPLPDYLQGQDIGRGQYQIQTMFPANNEGHEAVFILYDEGCRTGKEWIVLGTASIVNGIAKLIINSDALICENEELIDVSNLYSFSMNREIRGD